MAHHEIDKQNVGYSKHIHKYILSYCSPNHSGLRYERCKVDIEIQTMQYTLVNFYKNETWEGSSNEGK